MYSTVMLVLVCPMSAAASMPATVSRLGQAHDQPPELMPAAARGVQPELPQLRSEMPP